VPFVAKPFKPGGGKLVLSVSPVGNGIVFGT
jgi:hypothetical protein